MLGWNQLVTLRDPTHPDRQVEALCFARLASTEELRIFKLSAGYKWRLAWDGNLTYGDGTTPAANHEAIWARSGSFPDGSAKAGVLSKPLPDFGRLPTMVAFVEEAA